MYIWPCSSILEVFKHYFHTSLWEWVKIPTCGQLNLGSEGWSNLCYITKTVGFAGLEVQNCFHLLTWVRRGNPHSPTHIFTFQEHSGDWITYASQHWCPEGPWMTGHLRREKRNATNKPQRHRNTSDLSLGVCVQGWLLIYKHRDINTLSV